MSTSVWSVSGKYSAWKSLNAAMIENCAHSRSKSWSKSNCRLRVWPIKASSVFYDSSAVFVEWIVHLRDQKTDSGTPTDGPGKVGACAPCGCAFLGSHRSWTWISTGGPMDRLWSCATNYITRVSAFLMGKKILLFELALKPMSKDFVLDHLPCRQGPLFIVGHTFVCRSETVEEPRRDRSRALVASAAGAGAGAGVSGAGAGAGAGSAFWCWSSFRLNSGIR